jgi:glycerophosphoryl diester phosphodiesterase
MRGNVIGHRGCSRYPENTLRASEFALRSGADRVEIDVQHTTDGRLVLPQ